MFAGNLFVSAVQDTTTADVYLTSSEASPFSGTSFSRTLLRLHAYGNPAPAPGSELSLNVGSCQPCGPCLTDAGNIADQCSEINGTTNLLLQHTVLWKVAGKLIMPKPKGSTSEIKKSPSSGLKWSFSPGTNLLSGDAAKLEKESRQKLNEFSKELRTFRSVDLSGRNFGDDGLFFLAESLGYNQTLIVEEVDFFGNGITVVGLKTLDGVLQTNTMLKTLNLSGNNIGDEGAKPVFPHIELLLDDLLSLAMTRMYWKKMTSDMGCHIDGFITVVAHTHVIQEGPVTGRAADVIVAANTAAEVALRLVRPGKKFTNLKYSKVEIDEVRFEWAECMLDYI
ncbi:hypothetical protein ZIOFF_047550 [Zingiber officinale]|uniref:Uncharacterized protein n=1 Tax=Zingiber officinale TaxID=94328 RepID=A0A8J5KQH6_ZINOF|nr:hypothetical protein ZIOFF_047550 [Zingiber officinale]